MTREEVIANVEAKIKRIKHIMDEGDYGCVDIENWERWEKQLEYQEIILAALLGPQPDPDTGCPECSWIDPALSDCNYCKNCGRRLRDALIERTEVER